MEIRPMRAGDAAEVSRLYVKSWREGYKGLLPQEYLDSLPEDKWERSFVGSAGSIVMTDGGIIVGHTNARPAADEKMSGFGEVHTLYVLPEYWGQGCGTALLRHSVEWLSGLGFVGIYLWVLDSNTRARRFYEKNCFAETEDVLLCEVGGVIVKDIRYILK